MSVADTVMKGFILTKILKDMEMSNDGKHFILHKILENIDIRKTTNR